MVLEMTDDFDFQHSPYTTMHCFSLQKEDYSIIFYYACPSYSATRGYGGRESFFTLDHTAHSVPLL